MPTVVGGCLSVVSLSASIFAGNDPWTCLLRGSVAFAAGLFCTSVWYAATSRAVVGSVEEEAAITEAEEEPAEQSEAKAA